MVGNNEFSFTRTTIAHIHPKMAGGWPSTKSNEVSSLFGTFRTQVFAALALSVGAFFTIALLSSATPSALLSASSRQQHASGVLTAGKDILSEVKTFGVTFEASLKRKQQAQELAKTESLGQTKDMAAARDKLAAQQQLYYQADFFQNCLVARAGEAKAALRQL
jgi:hypothetical protein